MVQLEELIHEIVKRFEYKNNDLYWKDGPKKGKLAGYIQPDGYIYVRVKVSNKKLGIHAHRIIYAMCHGYLPTLVDHKDRNTKNNSIENLRDASKRLNSINTALPINNISGFKGVSKTRDGKWESYIKNFGKKIHLGRYINIEDAIKARKEAELRYWTDDI